MLLSNCASVTRKFIKNQEKLHEVVFSKFNNIWNDMFRMNKIVKKILLAGDKLMIKLYPRQPRIIYGVCEPFT